MSTRLTEQEYWDSQYSGHSLGPDKNGEDPQETPKPSPKAKGPRSRSYGDFLIFEHVYATHFSGREGQRVIEVGSAPGLHLLEVRSRFGLDPFGVEYAPAGVALNRQNFQQAGVNPDQVIEADFFSEGFLAAHQGTFDVVLSRGFIEHFSDARKVVERHEALLRPGGLLIVSIPNMRGFNYGLNWFFRPDHLPLHNLKIMKRSHYQQLFEGSGLQTSYCGYAGIMNLAMCSTKSAWKRWVLRVLRGIQMPINILLPMLIGKRHRLFESGFLSPYLLYIGSTSEPSED